MDKSSKAILEWPGGKLDFSGGCVVMGVLNVTPDSFSDGGQFFNVGVAIEHGLKMAADGAAIIDVGGESTRPGSESVSAEEQVRRVVPVIEGLRERMEVPVSIDTYKVEVAEAALEAGAVMINDITALGDEQMASVCVSNRKWAEMNPNAFFRKPLTIEEVMASKMLSTPLRAKMSNMLFDGGSAFIVTSAERAKDLPNKSPFQSKSY